MKGGTLSVEEFVPSAKHVILLRYLSIITNLDGAKHG